MTFSYGVPRYFQGSVPPFSSALVFIVALPGLVVLGEIFLATNVVVPLAPFLAGVGVVFLALLFYLSLVILLGVLFESRGLVMGVAFGFMFVSMIEVSAIDENSIDTALSAVDDTLRRAHKLKADADNDFTAVSQTELLSATATITGIMTVFLGAISGISLVVGGIA